MERKYTFSIPGKRLSGIWKDERKTGDNSSLSNPSEALAVNIWVLRTFGAQCYNFFN